MQLFSSQVDNNDRRTQAQKEANDFQWYKDKIDLLDTQSFSGNTFAGLTGVAPHIKQKVNYDLFNNKINIRDFEYVCKPFGAETGELPANFENRDIVSSKIKVLLGMEMSMPFDWSVIAVNEEAITRKADVEFQKIRDFVEAEIMKPIRVKIEQQVRAQSKGKQLTPEEEQQVQEQIDEETQAQTPDEVRKYMHREHKDPAEVLMVQILEYLQLKEKVKDKFNKGWKHVHLGGGEFYHVGIFNGEPGVKVVNTIRFDYDRSEDIEDVSEGEWAVEELFMTPSSIAAQFGSDLTDEQLDRIYEFNVRGSSARSADFTFDETLAGTQYTVRVLHAAFKSLRKVGFLSYRDSKGEIQEKMVDENYKLNKKQGDIEIEWEWLPESHHGYKILDDIYVKCEPIPGQFTDMDNLYDCRLCYYGTAYDNLNSETTSTMDRIKSFQYFYNVIIYRMELLMASDEGKIMAMNMNAIPNSMGVDLDKFMYFMKANKIAFLNPQEEGNKGGAGGDVTNMVKEINMSLISDISKYMDIANFIDERCGNSIGVTKAMEAQIGSQDAVSNTRQNIAQASHILRPHFEKHNTVKGNVLKALIETAKVAYTIGKPRKLSYILDDMSYKMLDIDQDLLDASTYGLFMSNASKAEEAKQTVMSLAQAAMQNQQADLIDVIKIVRADSITEAEELLQVARDRRDEQAQAADKAKAKAQKDAEDKAAGLRRDEMKHEEDMIVLKEKERRKTEIQKQLIASAGFDTNKDEDGDGEPDILEYAKFGADADIKQQKLDLDREKLEYQKEHDKTKFGLEADKIAVSKQKKTQN